VRTQNETSAPILLMSLAQLRVEMVVGMAQLSLKVKWPPLINCPATAIHSRPAIDECICRFVYLVSFPSGSIDCSSPWNDACSFLIPFACQQFIVQRTFGSEVIETFLRTLMVNFQKFELWEMMSPKKKKKTFIHQIR